MSLKIPVREEISAAGKKITDFLLVTNFKGA